jgi:anti-anti-sigma regulatory factor
MEPEYETRIGINENDETACLVLQGRIDAFVAGELHQDAQQLLDRSQDVDVVCEDVEHEAQTRGEE